MILRKRGLCKVARMQDCKVSGDEGLLTVKVGFATGKTRGLLTAKSTRVGGWSAQAHECHTDGNPDDLADAADDADEDAKGG